MSDTTRNILAPLAAFMLGVSFSAILTKAAWREITVDRGLAMYCPDTGGWAWVGECGE